MRGQNPTESLPLKYCRFGVQHAFVNKATTDWSYLEIRTKKKQPVDNRKGKNY